MTEQSVPLRVEEISAQKIDLDDPVLDTPKALYPEFATWWNESVLAENRPCLVARLDDARLRAIAVLKPRPDGAVKLCTFCVLEENRARGLQGYSLGTLFLSRVIAHLRKAGARRLYLTLLPHQQAEAKFLAHMGFRPGRRADALEIEL